MASGSTESTPLTSWCSPGNFGFMRAVLVAGIVLCSVVASWAAEVVPDFKLLDVNTNSVRRNTLVSPRDYRLQVSAFYFGQAH